MKRLTAFLLIPVLACSLFSGCAKGKKPYIPTGDALYEDGQDLEEYLAKEEKIQELTLAYFPDRSMNPLIGNNISNRALFSLIYQGLFSVDSKNTPHPILCSSYKVSPSGQTFTYYLDEKARFSDGSKVTAEDVLATYESARKSDYYSGRFTFVNSVSLTNDGGIAFVLTTPYEDFSMLLDVPIVKASEREAKNPLGTGPYTFQPRVMLEEEVESEAYMTRVENWWCDAKVPATAESVTLIPAATQAQIRDEFEFSDVGLAVANPMSDSFSDYRCDFELWEVENGVFLYLACNMSFSDFFKNDETLRKALTYGVDRETLVRDNYRGMAYPATLAASPASPYYSQSLAADYAYDAMKFIDMTGGWKPPKNKDKEPQTLRLLVNSDDSARLRTARDIAENLTELGVPTRTMEYGNTTKTTFKQVIAAGNYDLYLGQTKLSPNMDLSAFYGWSDLSRGGLTDKSLSKMCAESLANSGNHYNLLKDVAEDAKIIPVLFGYFNVYAERGLFENLSPSRDNTFFYTMERTMEDIKIPTDYS